MIEKVQGNWKVDKLCTILLYEADFNFLNKKLGGDALRHVEGNHIVMGGQYGSRRGGYILEPSESLFINA